MRFTFIGTLVLTLCIGCGASKSNPANEQGGQQGAAAGGNSNATGSQGQGPCSTAADCKTLQLPANCQGGSYDCVQGQCQAVCANANNSGCTRTDVLPPSGSRCTCKWADATCTGFVCTCDLSCFGQPGCLIGVNPDGTATTADPTLNLCGVSCTPEDDISQNMGCTAVNCVLPVITPPVAPPAQVAVNPTPCVLGYPVTTSNPRTSVDFNESTVLVGYEPQIATPGDTVKAFYVDEHALALGKNGNGKTVSPCNCQSGPDKVDNPSIRDPTAVDSYQRPLFPALFISDVTTDPNNRSGDWENGGTPIPPTAVLGTWKAVGANDPNCPNNTNNVGNGDTVPPPTDPRDQTRPVWAAEIQWNVKALNLTAGHVYRLEFIIHDGDQNSAGGDAAEACVTVGSK
jgi:hypothetical protein